jgi:polygalacturonase
LLSNLYKCTIQQKNEEVKYMSPVILFGCMLIIGASCKRSIYNIESFGAVADATTLNTKAIQMAIDKASAKGGGRVVVPGGIFVTGSIFLRTGVELYLEKGACLMGSTSRPDYGDKEAHALISAENQRHISVAGSGMIDGRGGEVVKDIYRLVRDGKLVSVTAQSKRPEEGLRPKLISFNHCHEITLRGITLKNSAAWVLCFQQSDSVIADALTIESSTYWNNDGIDVVNCRNVRITSCNINTSDDGICLKSEGQIIDTCRDILVESCTIRSSASAFKMGTGSKGGFRNVTVRDLDVFDTYRSAIAVECVDGGSLENIDIRGVHALNTGNAIFIKLGHRNTDGPVGRLEHIHISDVYVEVPAGKSDMGYPLEGPPVKYPHNVFPSSITGIPDHPVRDIVLENVEIVLEGGAGKELAFSDWRNTDLVPENEAEYPEFSMFGELPAWGFFVRHARNLVMKNVTLRILHPDYRPACIFDDVEGLALDSIKISGVSDPPFVVYSRVRQMDKEIVQLPRNSGKGIVTWK